MTTEETDVLNFLKSSPESWFNRKEIARKAAGRRAFEENPNWCVLALNSLVNERLIERNESGHYKYAKRY